MNLLFVMVGTTALTNRDVGCSPNHRDNRALKGEVDRYIRSRDQRVERWPQLLKELVDAHTRYWQMDSSYCFRRENWKETAAELTSSKCLIRDLQSRGTTPPEKVVLLASDTDEGEMAARVNESILRWSCAGMEVVRERVPGLEVKFSGLTESIERTVSQYREERKDPVVVNITGGFKGAIPSISYLAAFEGWKLYYQHEESGEGVYLDYVDGRLQLATTSWPRTWG